MSSISVTILLILYISCLVIPIKCSLFDEQQSEIPGIASATIVGPTYDLTVTRHIGVESRSVPPPAAASTLHPPPQNSLSVASPSLPLSPLINGASAIPTSHSAPLDWGPSAAVSGVILPSVTGLLASSITPPPVALGTSATLRSDDQLGCVPYYPCNIFFQFVGVHYWPQPGHNTSCLSGNEVVVLDRPQETAVPISPNGYVVFTSIRASDGCQQIGQTFVDFTATFGPGDLSSVRDASTYSFNFADLPCPPESVHWTMPGPYSPTVAFPPWMTKLDPAWSTCIAGASQGVDPFVALPTANRDSDFSDGGPFKRHRRAAPGRSIRTRAAAATTTTTTTEAAM